LVEVRTRGDAISARNARGGFEATDGQFTAELEEALLRGEVDVAVHSYKDLPTRSSPGAVVAAVLPRADARDCLLTRDGGGLGALSHGASVGTSSVRRARQLLLSRPDLSVEPIRGNVETRIARMHRGEYDAILLACAGLDRLGIAVPEQARLPFTVMLPAPAQGALAVQVHLERTDLLARLRTWDHAPTRIAVEAERALLRAIGGGCLAPLGAFGEVEDGRLRLRAIYLPDDGPGPASVDLSAPMDRVEDLVADAAHSLLHGEGGR
jgi:hydroxymethylbilane synthase